MSELEKKARALVEKLDLIFNSSAYNGIFSIAAVHGFEYRGEDCSKELKELRDILNEI